MHTPKEKEYDQSVHYLLILVTVSFLALLLAVEAVRTSPTSIPYLGKYIGDLIPKYPYILEKTFLASLSFCSLTFFCIQLAAKPNLKASKKKGNLLLVIAVGSFLLIIGLHGGHVGEFYLYALAISAVCMALSFIAAGANFNSVVYLPKKDLFNKYNEQFPQNETNIENDLSVTYVHQYVYKNEWRTGIVPILAPDRAVLIVGAQGSGKTFTVFNPAIYQNIQKGFSLWVYDYACPDLSLITFNGMVAALKTNKYTWGKKENGDAIIPEFNHLNFENLRYSNRCNPFQDRYMSTLDECNTMVKTLLYNLNKSWIGKEGDFWAVSAINLLTCYVWFLRIIERENPEDEVLNQVCTLPHAIQLLTQDIKEIINAISCEPELDAYSNMFVQGLKNQAGSQIAGQIASTQSALAPLSSPNVSWVMTGNDMDLEINNPQAPRIMTMGNYTLKDAVYGSAISVYASVIMKRSYLYRQRKFSLFIDELPTLYLMGLDNYIATIRKHKGCVWMGIQDTEQLLKNYGTHAGNIIVNTAGTTICGLVNGQTAERISKMFGKTEQENYSASVNDTTSISYSTQAKELLPASKIMSLSQGQLVGKFADKFETPIEQKLFSGFFVVPTVKQEYQELPLKYDIPETQMQELVKKNALKIRSDINAVKEYCISNYS